MTLSKLQEVTLVKVRVQWEQDTDSDYPNSAGSYPIFAPSNARGYNSFATMVDIEGTIDEYVKDGYSLEDARKNTAQDRQRMIDWNEARWTYLGCIVTAIDDEGHDAAQSSLSCIESDSGKSYQEEVERDLLSELYHSVVKAGFDCTQEEFDSLPVDNDEDWRFTEYRRLEGIKPIPELPVVHGLTFEYYYLGDGPISFRATCDECGETWEDCIPPFPDSEAYFDHECNQ